jgi:hypothetical protein
MWFGKRTLTQSSTLKLEVVYFAETLAKFCRTTWRYVQGENTHHSYRLETLKSNKKSKNRYFGGT